MLLIKDVHCLFGDKKQLKLTDKEVKLQCAVTKDHKNIVYTYISYRWVFQGNSSMHLQTILILEIQSWLKTYIFLGSTSNTYLSITKSGS